MNDSSKFILGATVGGCIVYGAYLLFFGPATVTQASILGKAGQCALYTMEENITKIENFSAELTSLIPSAESADAKVSVITPGHEKGKATEVARECLDILATRVKELKVQQMNESHY